MAKNTMDVNKLRRQALYLLLPALFRFLMRPWRRTRCSAS